MRLTEIQKTEIKRLRNDGWGYMHIAEMTAVPVGTVRTFCRRNGLTGRADNNSNIRGCLQCGNPVTQNPGRKEKKFCSDVCRTKWWNTHHRQINKKAIYEFTCLRCRKVFTAYGNNHRRYCSHDCYIADRFGGGQDEN